MAKVYQIDKAHKVIVISGKIQDKISTGDKVYAKTSSTLSSLLSICLYGWLSFAKLTAFDVK
jgi:predicted S18 family serine protease